jgi:protein-L-isoaspartate(D-aspartate) O-methyltransferase
MYGWPIPPPKKPTKTRARFERERKARVARLCADGLLRSGHIKRALLKVAREDFIPEDYRDYAYEELPFPLPGKDATISCPHSYPLFYEPLGLDPGHKFLEIGLGSGYGTAIAREVVGEQGLVVAVEIDPLTYAFARENLEKLGYDDVVLVQGDGGLGYAALQPYDCISVTAACVEIPPPLIEQLAIGGRLVAPVYEADRQDLVLLTKTASGVERKVLCQVLYVPLRGQYGAV